MQPYVVRQGDYLAKIAARLGFDADSVWNAPDNDPLRAQGRTPNVLAPGDILYVPNDKPAWRSLDVGQTNEYVAGSPAVSLTMTFVDENGDPLANTECVYDGLRAVTAPPAATDGAGSLQIQVPVDQEPFLLVFPSTQVSFMVRVGHVDPHTTAAGALQRLYNLGYGGRSYFGPEAAAGDLENPDPEGAFALMLRSFQHDRGLEQTGELDSATADALKDAHGS
jgi:hypothetical protein